MTESSAPVSRTFFELPAEDGRQVEDISFLRGFSRDGTLTWERLLQADRVLIVSEAGMGKTYECQRRQKRLWEDGEPAFFLELADLGSEELTAHFNPAEKLRFLGWQSAQTERAVFFLDSIDELKLTSRSFQGTLKRFATAIGGNLGRACIVLTTRPGTDDREAVERLLPIPTTTSIGLPEDIFVTAAMREHTNKAPEEPPSSRWRYVALAPLNSEQQRTIAQNHGVYDSEKLLAAIDAEHAQEFAKRPLDFIELCEDWNANGKIRGHRDQIESNIHVKLKPNLERKEPAELSAMKAREGAERLALAALMTRRFTFWHGKDTRRGHGDGALDPALVLSDWQPSEVRTLLERPLFGFATYARVRFQNRSIIEYLAAERIRSLLAKGLAPRTLSRLLFVTAPERVELVRPTMQPVAAWLASTEPSVVAELLKRDPSVLLRFGDPGTLDFTLRISALERYVAVYGAGGWRGMHVPPLQARRLSSPALSPTIERLWSQGIENAEVRETLLDLIEAGKLTENSEIAFEAATDPQREVRERLSALLALAALGDERLPRILDQMASLEAHWTGRLATSAIVYLFPRVMSVPQLTGILAGLTYARGHDNGISRLLPSAIARAKLSSTTLESLRGSLTGLIAADQHWDSLTYRIQSSRRDLVWTLVQVCELQLRERARPLALAESIALVLQLSSDDHDRDERFASLRTQLASASHSVRAAVFWAQERLLAATLTERESEVRDVRMMWPPAMMLQATDVSWLRDALSEIVRPAEQRMIALHSLIHLARESDVQLDHLKSLRVLVADDFDLSEHLNGRISTIEDPPPAPSWVAEQAKRRDDQVRQQNESRAFWVDFFRSLIVDSLEPLDNEGRRQLAGRLTSVMARASRDSQYAGWNRSFLEGLFEKQHVERLRRLVIDIWRTIRPTLPSERADNEKNIYYPSWRIGLAGLYAEAEDPAWARQLDSSEAELAMRYAITSMYDLPLWVDDLAADHPEVVRGTLCPELDDQLVGSGVQHQHSSMLVSIAQGRPKLLALMLGDVRCWVKDVLAKGVGSLYKADKFTRAIELLLDNGDPADMAMVHAAARAALQDAPLAAQASFWLPLLMRLAPSEAVNELERLASKCAPAEGSPVVQWLAVLFGHNARPSFVSSEIFDSPTLLARLTVLAYEHVRIEDDRPRDGVRNSNMRDDAEFARSQLLSALFKSRGGDAWQEKLKFVKNPLLAHFRDRGVAIARQSLAEEWDAPNYTLADLALLEKSWDVPPVTRADMAAMLADRLDQLDDRLREDSSPRKTWAGTKEESELRRLVAAEMERLAKGAYSVSQEQVTAEEKETDVRLRSSGYEMEAVIELKIGENGYTYSALSKALNHQLLGRYMAPEARRVGCLVISIARNRKWKHPEHGGWIDIDEVVLLLREEAKGVVRSLGYESLLDVRALDLRPRQLS